MGLPPVVKPIEVTGEPPIVILVGTQHPGNAGAAARGAANFGVTEMRFVRPQCDFRDKEALDRAVHAEELLLQAKVYATLEEALVGTSLSVGTTARTSPAENHFLRKPMDIRDWLEGQKGWSGKMAIVFGPEASGLTRADTNLLDQLVTVPTATYASLNLAHAVSLVCYEHFRQRAGSTTPERTLDPDALRAMHEAWDDLIDETEGRAWRREIASGVWRKIIGRSAPSTYEVHNIMGILSRALRRFGHPAYRTQHADAYMRERGMTVAPREAEQAGPGPDAAPGPTDHTR